MAFISLSLCEYNLKEQDIYSVKEMLESQKKSRTGRIQPLCKDNDEVVRKERTVKKGKHKL